MYVIIALQVVSITSFNEWGEGTQIEPCLPVNGALASEYSDYGVLGPEGYLDRTASWTQRFDRIKKDSEL